MNYSRKVVNEAKTLRLDVKTKAMADLMAVGWKAKDAFIVLGLAKISLSDQYNENQMEKIITDEPFTTYAEKIQKRVTRAERSKTEDKEQEEDLERIISKEEVASEMLKTIRSLQKNDPKRAELLSKYADLMQYKKEEMIVEDDTIHFYLPISCNKCSLYNEAKTKNIKL